MARNYALKVRAGNVQGMNLRIKPAVIVTEKVKKKRVIVGELRDFVRACIITGITDKTPKTYRYYELIPGAKHNKIEHGEFYVEGRFEIVKSILKSRKANEAWKAFEVNVSQ